MPYVALASERRANAPRRHVHAQGPDWEVTSDVPVDQLSTCDVLARALPGALGCYFFPADAVLCSDRPLAALLAREREQLRITADLLALNHLTVEEEEEDEPAREEDDEEEEREDDDAADEEEVDDDAAPPSDGDDEE